MVQERRSIITGPNYLEGEGMGCRAQVEEGAIEARVLLTRKHKDPRRNGHNINWWLGSER